MTPRQPSPIPSAIAAFAAPAALGLMLGWVGESTVVGALTLLAEPLLLTLAVYLVLALLSSRCLGAGLGLLGGVIVGGALIRLPPEPQPIADVHPEWAMRLRSCTQAPEAPRGPVRLALWTLDPDHPRPIDPNPLLASQPDVIIIQNTDHQGLGERLAAMLDGDTLHLEGDNPNTGLTLVTRGSFQYCGGHQDHWEMRLPSTPQHDARLVVVFPEIPDVGVLPLMTVHLDNPGRMRDWSDWPRRLLHGTQQVAAVARTLDPNRLIVAGDFEAPRSFRRVAGQLLGARLTHAPVPASWPTRVGPLPLPTLHTLDQVWTGDAWQSTRSTSLTAGAQARRPIVVDLAPSEP